MEEYDDQKDSAFDSPHASDESAITTRGYFHHKPEKKKKTLNKCIILLGQGKKQKKA